MNRVELVGRLTRDPELRYTESGKAVCNFSIAVNEGYGEKRQTEYVDCVAWEKQAERVAEQARIGTEVYANGRLQTRKWQDRTSGETKRKTEVVIGTLVIAGSGGGDSGADKAAVGSGVTRRADPTREQAPQTTLDIDDIPF